MIATTDTTRPNRIAIYTSTFSSYDVLLSPLRMTPGCDYIAFCDTPQPMARKWHFLSMPEGTEGMPQNEANRYCKLFHTRVLPDHDVSIYVDGNILLCADLTPLIEEFLASGADIALFPAAGNRSVAEEIRISGHAVRPLQDLRAAGLADLPVTMNGILFRRHDRPELDRLMQDWWDDINRYAMRDQYSLPGLLATSDVTVHRWGWEYYHVDNPYFAVYAHRIGKPRLLPDLIRASQIRGRFRTPDRLIWGPWRWLKRIVRHAS